MYIFILLFKWVDKLDFFLHEQLKNVKILHNMAYLPGMKCLNTESEKQKSGEKKCS